MTVDVPYTDDEVTEAFGNALSFSDDHKSRLSLSERYTSNKTVGLRLQKAIADIQDGTRKSFRILSLGDSLTGTSWSTVNNQLARALAGWLQSTPIYANTIDALEAGPNADDVVAKSAAQANWNSSESTSTVNEKVNYDVSFTGYDITIDTGELATFSEGGNSVTGDRLLIPIITEPGAGSVKIELSSESTPPAYDDVSWRDVTAPEITSSHTLTGSELIVDADDTFGVTVVELSVDLGKWNIKVTHEAGDAVRMQPPMHEVSTAAAINNYRLSASASNDFANALSTAEPVVAGIIAAYDPDIIVVESDDRLPAYENFLPILEDTVDTAALDHQPLILLVGNPFYDNAPYDDSDIIERIDYCWDYIQDKIGWDVIDGIALAGGLDEADAAGWGSDGIHYNGDMAWHITRKWALKRGFFPVEEKRPGGDASRADIFTGSSRRLLTAGNAPALSLLPVADTGWMEWAYDETGSASGAMNPSSLYLTTGSTAGSGVSAYINEAKTPLGLNQGILQADFRGFTTTVRVASTMTSDYYAFIGSRTQSWNSGYNGALTGGGTDWGVGFQLSDGIVEGVCVDDSNLLSVSAESYAISPGGSSSWVQLTCLIHPQKYSSSAGEVEWLVNGQSLGTSRMKHQNFRGIRAELGNGAASTNFNLYCSPPRVMTMPL